MDCEHCGRTARFEAWKPNGAVAGCCDDRYCVMIALWRDAAVIRDSVDAQYGVGEAIAS